MLSHQPINHQATNLQATKATTAQNFLQEQSLEFSLEIQTTKTFKPTSEEAPIDTFEEFEASNLKSSPQLSFNFEEKTPQKKRGAHKTFSSDYIHRLQKKHFLVLNVAPFYFTLLAIALIPIRPPTAIDLMCLLFFWALTEFCIVAGYHRYFTHRSFKCSPIVKNFFHIGGLMAGQGGLVSWVALHRRHHECSDHNGDPHSPYNGFENVGLANRLKGIFHAHFFWMKKHEYPNVMFYASELCRDKTITKIDRFYIYCVTASLILPGIVAFLFTRTLDAFLFGVLWGGIVRLFLLNTSIGAVNSLLHTIGYRKFNTPDNSRNAPAFALLTFGDAYHNNHHAFPRSASAGLHKYSIDPAFWIIKGLEKLHLTWDIYVPSQKRIDQYTHRQS